MESKDNDFFDKFGLEVASGDVEVGGTYPIYGMITNIFDESSSDDGITVEINFSIHAKLDIKDSTKIELLKSRAFEPGIFVSTVTSKTDKIFVDCNTVVFGRKQKCNA